MTDQYQTSILTAIVIDVVMNESGRFSVRPADTFGSLEVGSDTFNEILMGLAFELNIGPLELGLAFHKDLTVAELVSIVRAGLPLDGCAVEPLDAGTALLCHIGCVDDT